MPVTLKMALRNVREHKSKSLIIGILLLVGAFVIVLGNAFMDASKAGIRTSFTENYTGDVFVSGISEDGDVSLFGVMSPGGMAPTPTIPDYEKVFAKVTSMPKVSKASGMATGYGIVTKEANNEEDSTDTVQANTQSQSSSAASTATATASQDSTSADASKTTSSGNSQDMMEKMMPDMRFLFLFGIDANNYWDVFDSVQLASGSRLKPGEIGIILNEKYMDSISKSIGKTLHIGDTLVIQGMSSMGMKLREVPIVGTYVQRDEGSMPEQLAFIDINTLRVMAGMTVGANEAIKLSAENTNMLSTENPDELFSSDLVVSPTSSSGFNEARLQAQLADKTVSMKANEADTGAWQFIVIRTKRPSDSASVIKELNDYFNEEGIAAVAGDWQKAAGPYGQSVDVIRIVFSIAISVLFIVAIIIIMNTFVISVIERTGEIGTMRAIGADKGFIRKLFAAESLTLSVIFSTIGASLALLVVTVIRLLKISSGNMFFEVLFGGKYISPFVTPLNFFGAILAMSLVGFLAHLYPVSVALKIQPVQAMQSE